MARQPGPVPREALAYFRAKKLKPGFDYRDVWREEHRHAFTVAKAMQQDILVDIRDAVDDAIANGIPFDQFSKNLTPILQEKGWWGRKDVVDPLTGETISAQLGSPRRLRTIYNANVRSARSAGQWDRIQRTKRTHPYLLYELGPSEQHRVEHANWSGILLPVDHPFWKTHFTPNGYGCKCHIRQVSKAEYSRLSASGKYQTEAPKIETRDWVNKRTGEVETVPVGIDPGWDINPGTDRAKVLARDLSKKQEIAKARLAQPLPPTNLYKAGEPGVLSTASKVNQGSLENAIASMPGNEQQREQFSKFMQAHPIKTLFIKASEMSSRNKASRDLADKVKGFLGSNTPPFPQMAYTVRNATRINGFTFQRSEHVVVKVKAGTSLTGFKGEALRQAVGDAIELAAKGERTWSFSHQVAQVVGSSDDATRVVSTWIHEVGHQVHFWSGDGIPPVRLAESITTYGRTNAREWHAEHFLAWLVNREALARWNPSVASYFDNLVEGAINRGSK